jgi:poly-D-alanine transfer protein DltD
MTETLKSVNEQGLSVELVKISETNYETILGGDDSNPNWEEYINQYRDEWKAHIQLIKKFVEENGLIGTTGETQNQWAFKFSDGNAFGFTWRGWGDFMQAIVNKREGYMAYYM